MATGLQEHCPIFKVNVALCVATFIIATVSCGTVKWNAHFPMQCFKLGARIAQSI